MEVNGSFVTGNGATQLGQTRSDSIDVRGSIIGRTPLVFGGTLDDENKMSIDVEEPTSEWHNIVIPDASGRLVVGPGFDTISSVPNPTLSQLKKRGLVDDLKDILSSFYRALRGGDC
jgi:hypothetical protein